MARITPPATRSLPRALPAMLAGRPMILLVGILADKDAAAMVSALIQHAVRAVVTDPPLTDRAGAADRIASLAQARRPNLPVSVVRDPANALHAAIQLGNAEKGVVVVAGSLYLIGAIRPLLL